MATVKIRQGVYGCRSEPGGRVRPVGKGELAAVSDEEAARLIALGVAEAAQTPEPTQEDAELTPAALERMSRARLEALAAGYGVDLSGAKNNQERSALLQAALFPQGAEEPVLE